MKNLNNISSILNPPFSSNEVTTFWENVLSQNTLVLRDAFMGYILKYNDSLLAKKLSIVEQCFFEDEFEDSSFYELVPALCEVINEPRASILKTLLWEQLEYKFS